MKRFRITAALGLAIVLVCLSAAPATAAATPRAEDLPHTGLLALYDFTGQVADLFGDWIRSVFAATDAMGDPDG